MNPRCRRRAKSLQEPHISIYFVYGKQVKLAKRRETLPSPKVGILAKIRPAKLAQAYRAK